MFKSSELGLGLGLGLGLELLRRRAGCAPELELPREHWWSRDLRPIIPAEFPPIRVSSLSLNGTFLFSLTKFKLFYWNPSLSLHITLHAVKHLNPLKNHLHLALLKIILILKRFFDSLKSWQLSIEISFNGGEVLPIFIIAHSTSFFL